MTTKLETKDFNEGKDFIVFDDHGELDDIALTGVTLFRMERMSDNTFWMRIYREGGKDIVFWLGAEPNEKRDDRSPHVCKIVGHFHLDYEDEPLNT